MFDHEPKPPDSLLKMMGDIFSSRDTSGIFYTNDMMVFIDIIIRQLNDLSAGDSVSVHRDISDKVLLDFVMI